MGSHKLREDKNCLNCGATVECRFCPDCGQENTGTRHSFAHLFAHFFDDFTHYDNAFWRTIKYLCFQPARLTREYLSGRRAAFLPPVRLYIFISFITFFLMNMLPNAEDYHASYRSRKKEITREEKDSIFREVEKTTKNIPGAHSNLYHFDSNRFGNTNLKLGDYETVAQLDSIQSAAPASRKFGRVRYWFQRKFALINEHNRKNDDFVGEISEAFLHNLPKALFIYMPFFAFGLWIFHGKKRWLYFDHGIFTLHYFSFLLLTLSAIMIINSLTSFMGDTINSVMTGVLSIALMLWWFFYFFRSHRRMYGESRLISRTKGLALFIINLFFILLFMIGLIMVSILSIK